MSLNITPDMIHELHERTARADQTGIVLTDEGWQVETWTQGNPYAGLIALTAQDVYGWLDGTEFDDDAAEALATGQDYRIRSETGTVGEPAPGTDYRIAVDATGEDAQEWESAWWFDFATARELVGVPRGDLNRGRAASLWQTSEGTYLLRIRSVWEGEQGDRWQPISLAAAVEHVYDVELALLADDLPAELEAATLAAQLVAVMAAPQPGYNSDPEVADAMARRRLGEATGVVHGTRALSDLLRQRVLSDLKRERAAAAGVVVRACGGNEAAAQHLGMAYQTLANLL